jgi:hypothetical protein
LGFWESLGYVSTFIELGIEKLGRTIIFTDHCKFIFDGMAYASKPRIRRDRGIGFESIDFKWYIVVKQCFLVRKLASW